jgi:hypothetical protein
MLVINILSTMLEIPVWVLVSVFFLVISFLCYFWWRRRNDGDYTVIKKYYSDESHDAIVCYVDLQHVQNGKVLLKKRISWDHQTLSDFSRTIRIKNGIFYLVKKGYPDYAPREELILLERRDLD